MNDFFYAYDKSLMRYLAANNIRYNCTGFHTVTRDQFWQYTQSDKLSKLLIDYKGVYQK